MLYNWLLFCHFEINFVHINVFQVNSFLQAVWTFGWIQVNLGKLAFQKQELKQKQKSKTLNIFRSVEKRVTSLICIK